MQFLCSCSNHQGLITIHVTFLCTGGKYLSICQTDQKRFLTFTLKSLIVILSYVVGDAVFLKKYSHFQSEFILVAICNKKVITFLYLDILSVQFVNLFFPLTEQKNAVPGTAGFLPQS